MNYESSMENIEGVCPSCKTKSSFEYRGIQETMRGPYLILYNCTNDNCKSTLNLESIIEYNKLKEL